MTDLPEVTAPDIRQVARDSAALLREMRGEPKAMPRTTDDPEEES